MKYFILILAFALISLCSNAQFKKISGAYKNAFKVAKVEVKKRADAAAKVKVEPKKKETQKTAQKKSIEKKEATKKEQGLGLEIIKEE